MYYAMCFQTTAKTDRYLAKTASNSRRFDLQWLASWSVQWPFLNLLCFRLVSGVDIWPKRLIMLRLRCDNPSKMPLRFIKRGNFWKIINPLTTNYRIWLPPFGCCLGQSESKL